MVAGLFTSFSPLSISGIVELTIPKVTILSIQKLGCGNYLFIRKFVQSIWVAS
jgi:hypothetical protein